jgi:hypothetical protein
VPPKLDNIFLDVLPKSSLDASFAAAMAELKLLRQAAPRRIFFCEQQLDAGAFFSFAQDLFQENQVLVIAFRSLKILNAVERKILS